mmetsp:Transcript_171271/g.544066  ORF Transcript_171271/g.544066 Transcript_171271/m.544066 type:complete len:542 (+) Transcript_171271:99-1724(+)
MYKCAVFDLQRVAPDLDFEGTKYHIAEFAPLLEEASKQHVHHMLIYECDPSAIEPNNYSHNKVIDDCGFMMRGCSALVWPWAVGGLNTVLPADVGLPIGKGKRWLAIQMHYYNPQLLQGITDSSGGLLKLAPSLRTFEAGMMSLNAGVMDRQRKALPVGEAQTKMPPLVVPPGCTSSWDSEGIDLLGVFHHAHFLGRTLNIQVARAGEDLGSLRRELMYDFNHQSMEAPSIKHLLLGDELRATCSYDTRSAKEPVAFGESTQDEMCWFALLYYPVQVMSDIHYSPPKEAGVDGSDARSMWEAPEEETIKLLEDICLQPGSGSFSNMSKCAQLFVEDPVRLLMGEAVSQIFTTLGGKITAVSACNEGINSPRGRISTQDLEVFSPGICPSKCRDEKSCTLELMTEHGQSSLCKHRCGGYSLTVWPDVSGSEVKISTNDVICVGVGKVQYEESAPRPRSVGATACLTLAAMGLDDDGAEPESVGSQPGAQSTGSLPLATIFLLLCGLLGAPLENFIGKALVRGSVQSVFRASCARRGARHALR